MEKKKSMDKKAGKEKSMDELKKTQLRKVRRTERKKRSMNRRERIGKDEKELWTWKKKGKETEAWIGGGRKGREDG